MGLKGFERRLERLVEGVFTRAFRSSVRPVELGRRLVREMDDQRTVNVRGDMAAPNSFTITLGPEDYEQFAEIEGTITRELADTAREHARQEAYTFLGPVTVDLRHDPELRTGSFALSARFREGAGGVPGATLVLPGGQRVTLADTAVVLGRAADANVHLLDTSVSRRHAEVRPTGGGGYAVVDLGSTNGTKVNGAGVASQELRDGDTISVGDTHVRFEASSVVG